MIISDIDMRDALFDGICNIAKKDSGVLLLTADMGAYSLTRYKQELPAQYFNVGIAEQNMVSVAAGLALGGKKVFIYTIIPFATLRCYDQIRIDLCCMNLPVTIIGVGPGLTYESDGPTHHATQDVAVMRVLPEITIFNTSDSVMTAELVKIAYKSPSPQYIRLDKGKFPTIYKKNKSNFLEGLTELKQGSDLTIISTGTIIHKAMQIAKELENHTLSIGIVDLYRVKPLNIEKLLEIIDKSRRIITLEENSIIGGIGSAVSEILSDNRRNIPLKRIAIPDEHCFYTGNRESLLSLYKLDVYNIAKSILKWL